MEEQKQPAAPELVTLEVEFGARAEPGSGAVLFEVAHKNRMRVVGTLPAAAIDEFCADLQRAKRVSQSRIAIATEMPIAAGGR